MVEGRDEDLTGTAPAAGQQHGDSSGDGGTADPPKDETEPGLHHPRPDTPGSRVEDQADQPGMEEGGK